MGSDDDTYLNITNGDTYLKVSGVWVVDGSIKGVQGDTGPQGDEGADGPTGANGSTGLPGNSIEWLPGGWVFGGIYSATNPTHALENNGSSYICIQDHAGAAGITQPGVGASSDLYWALMAQEGATGPQGEVGPQGATGLTGAVGPPGADGADGDGTGDMLKSENLSGLADYGAARKALSLEPATADEWRTSGASKVLTTNVVWDAVAVEGNLISTGYIPWDMSKAFDFEIGLTNNQTLTYPTNVTVGKRGRIRVVQAVGGKTLSFASGFQFANGDPPVLSTEINAEDILYYDVISPTRILILSVLEVS